MIACNIANRALTTGNGTGARSRDITAQVAVRARATTGAITIWTGRVAASSESAACCRAAARADCSACCSVTTGCGRAACSNGASG